MIGRILMYCRILIRVEMKMIGYSIFKKKNVRFLLFILLKIKLVLVVVNLSNLLNKLVNFFIKFNLIFEWRKKYVNSILIINN